MRKRGYFIILFLLIILTVTAMAAITITGKNNNVINDGADTVKSLIGVEEADKNEPADRYEIVTIEVNGYKQLKEEIEKHSSWDNKSYIFNLNDGDYNITGTINCGNSHSDAQYTINGNGHVIDGNHKYQFMELFANLKLKDLTVQNTVPVNSNSSSAITMESVSELYIKDCNFINNYGKTKGSTLTNRGTCHITGCKFVNNSVDEVGGAIWSTGEYGGSLSVIDSLFKDNVANLQENNDRTSIIYMVSYGNNTIKDNRFINNTGRCIHSFNLTNTSIVNNQFIDNLMNEKEVIRGGLIDNYEADIHIKNNEFINDTTNGELRGGILYHEIGYMEFTGNMVDNINVKPEPTSVSTCSKGGVIFNRNASATISDNIFRNVLRGNYSRGGVIYNNLGKIELKDNEFMNTVEGDHIRGIIVFNDVNSIINVGNNTYNATIKGSVEAVNDEDKRFYNSDVKNDEGTGTLGKINYL